MNQNCQSKICKMNAKESQYQSHNEIPGRNRCRCSSISIGKVRNNRHAAIKFKKSMLTAFLDCSADRTKCKIFLCGNMTVDLPLSKLISWSCFQCNINFDGNVSKTLKIWHSRWMSPICKCSCMWILRSTVIKAKQARHRCTHKLWNQSLRCLHVDADIWLFDTGQPTNISKL